MKHYIKSGLIVGVIGLVLNSCVSAAFGLCGPFTALIAGFIAGYISVRKDSPALKKEGARLGMIAGAIAGGMVLLGQLAGGVVSLVLAQALEVELPFGYIPSTSADPTIQATYYLSGLGTSVCFGLVGLILAGLAGAGGGYVGTTEDPDPENSKEIE